MFANFTSHLMYIYVFFFFPYSSVIDVFTKQAFTWKRENCTLNINPWCWRWKLDILFHWHVYNKHQTSINWQGFLEILLWAHYWQCEFHATRKKQHFWSLCFMPIKKHSVVSLPDSRHTFQDRSRSQKFWNLHMLNWSAKPGSLFHRVCQMDSTNSNKKWRKAYSDQTNFSSDYK